VWLQGDVGAYSDDAKTTPCPANQLVEVWVDEQSGNLTEWQERSPHDEPLMVAGDPDFDSHDILYYTSAAKRNSRCDLTGLSTSTSHTFLWAVYFAALTANSKLLNANANTPIVYARNPSSQFGFYDGTAHRSSGYTGSAGAVLAIGLTLDAGGLTGRFWANGAEVGSAMAYSGTCVISGTAGLMASSDGLSGWCNAYLAEFQWYDTALSDDDMGTEMARLDALYGW
jgi:hypothetical protein